NWMVFAAAPPDLQPLPLRYLRDLREIQSNFEYFYFLTSSEPDRLRRSEEIKVFKIGWYFPQISQITQRKCLVFPADLADLADLAEEGFGISRRSRRGRGSARVAQWPQALHREHMESSGDAAEGEG